MQNASNNNVGSTILALSGINGRLFRRNPKGNQVKCQIALERNGILRPLDERAKTGKTLTTEAYRSFAKIAKGEGKDAEGAKTVLDLAKRIEGIVTERNAKREAKATAAA
jgi:hypothetical protein